MSNTMQLQWERSPSEIRCRVPRQSSTAASFGGTLLIIFGSAIGFWPIFATVMGSRIGPPDHKVPLEVVLMPLAFFGIFCFPIAGVLIIKGILMVAGRAEFILEGDRFSAVTQCGPFWRTYRCDLQDLAGFRVETNLGGAAASGLTVGRASLVAVRHQGRATHLIRVYPEKLIRELADELAKECELFATRQGIAWQGRANSDEVSLDPREIEERTDSPLGSNAVYEQQGGGCMITLPAKGWRRSSSGFARIWCYFWVGMTLIFTAFLLPALIMGNVQGSPGAGWFMLTIIWMVAVGTIVVLLNGARRCGKIMLTDGKLRFEEVALFETHRAEWNPGSIKNVIVGALEHKSEDSTRWENYITVWPEKEKSRRWFSNRDKSELEWIVSLLHEALDLDVEWRSHA